MSDRRQSQISLVVLDTKEEAQVPPEGSEGLLAASVSSMNADCRGDSPRSSLMSSADSTGSPTTTEELELDEDLLQAVEVDLMLHPVKVKTLDPSESSAGFESTSSTSSSSVDYACDCMSKIEDLHHRLGKFVEKHQHSFNKIGLLVLAMLYVSYFIWAVISNHKRAIPLIIATCVGVLGLFYHLVDNYVGQRIHKYCCVPVTACIGSKWRYLKWVMVAGFITAVGLFLILEVRPRPEQLFSVVGLFVFLLLLFLCSKHPSKVQFHTVAWGLALQFMFAVLILRTSWGYTSIHFLGTQMQKFLSFADIGAKFVFGEKYEDHLFAFKVLPVIVFFSCVISILYHLGVMQFVISKLAWVMRLTMGTSASESIIAAGNIFVGQTEAPILVRPFIEDMTKSELHAMMTSGFATIAGGVLAAYISFGVPAEHLLCASVMNAPIALAVSKLLYPETRQSKTLTQTIQMDKGKSRNLLEAAASGASSSILLVANIAANLIAFLALLAFVNASLSWFGSLVGHPQVTFQWLCGYAFTPVAFLMGVEWKDCGAVGQLLGIKTFLNEFVAYEELSSLISNRRACMHPQISPRSEVITTYALCGFANLSSISVQLGGLGPMAPSRKGDLAQLAVRALVAGTVACFITACVAGLLVTEEPPVDCANSTLSVRGATTMPSLVTTLPPL